MEAIAGVASVVGLIVPLASIAKLAGSLYVDLREAPDDMAGLRNRTLFFKGIFDTLTQLQNDAQIPEQCKVSLLPIVRGVEEALKDLQKEVVKLKRGTRASIKWTLLERQKMQKIERQLHQRESDLLLVLMYVLILDLYP